MVVVLRLYSLEQCPELNFGHRQKLIILLRFTSFCPTLACTIPLLKREPPFDEVDNSGHWSSFTYRPLFQPKGAYMCHTMPAGATAVPVNKVTGKRQQAVLSSSRIVGNRRIIQETIADLVPQETYCFPLTDRYN
jgi:hypothetical protein